jgi:hypothetical protein
LQAALVHQVDDQLQLVQALEVRDLRLVAGLDQRLEAGLDSALTPPHSTACSPNRSVSVSSANVVSMTPARVHADALRVRQRERARLAGRVLVIATAPACPPPRYSSRTRWPGDFGATIDTSTSGRRLIVPKRMLKPCANITVLPARGSARFPSRRSAPAECRG